MSLKQAVMGGIVYKLKDLQANCNLKEVSNFL
jgi:hypothetical protein